MAIAFFDLDRTLLSLNSGVLWVRRELREKHISPFQALRAGVWMARYQLGFATLESALKKAIGYLAGSPEAEMRTRTRAFYEQEVQGLYRSGARRKLAWHRERKDELVLLTASSLYLAELAMKDLALDAVLCNRFEVDARGLHTGRSEGPLCFGAGKLEHARSYAALKGEKLSDCFFYTDSFSDLPVLLEVGHPVAVNPDVRLEREARRRGWPVVEWGGPDADARPFASAAS